LPFGKKKKKYYFQNEVSELIKMFSLFYVQVYLINLKRRLDRRTRMLKTMSSLGIHTTLMDAVDGK